MVGDRSRPATADEDPYEKDGTEPEPYDTERDRSAFPYSWASWGGGWGLRTHTRHGGVPEGDEAAMDDDESRRDGSGYAMLVVVGAALFLFPEPATSLVGVLLLLLGAGGWLADAVR